MGHFSGFTLLLPFDYFRQFHWDHHRHTQDPQRDPELASPKPRARRAYLLEASGLPNWGRRIRTVAAHALQARAPQPWIPAARQRAVVCEARLYALADSVALVGSIALQT